MQETSHKNRKDSLQGSLDRVWFTAELEFPKILVPRLPQRTSNLNMEYVGKVKTTVLFIWDQLLAALIHLIFITLTLICFTFAMPGVAYVIYGCSCARTTGVSLYWSFTLEKNIIAVINQDRVIEYNLKRQIKYIYIYIYIYIYKIYTYIAS